MESDYSEGLFNYVNVPMNKRRHREIKSYAIRRPYYGTKLDKELKNAKDRATAHRCGDD